MAFENCYISTPTYNMRKYFHNSLSLHNVIEKLSNAENIFFVIQNENLQKAQSNSFEYALVSVLQLTALSSFFIKYSWVYEITKYNKTKNMLQVFLDIYLTLTRIAKVIS